MDKVSWNEVIDAIEAISDEEFQKAVSKYEQADDTPFDNKEIVFIDGDRTYVLVSDEFKFSLEQVEKTYNIAVSTTFSKSELKQSIRHAVELNKADGFQLVNQEDERLLIDECLCSDSGFVTLKKIELGGSKVTFVRYRCFFKYNKVPDDFKATFDEYYDQFTLFKVNLYTDPELFNFCESAAFEIFEDRS